MATLILEFNQSGRHDTQFRRIENFPYTIGRAYDNDLILTDDTVSPHHLVIEENEEGYWLRNLSNENGTWVGELNLGNDIAKLKPPMHLTLGRTTLKILTTDTAIAPTRHFPHASWLTLWASDLRVAIALLSVYLMLSVFFALERQSLWLNWEEVLVSQLFEIVLPLVAATAISFISRMLLHRWRFPLQLSIACIALGILNFSDHIIDVLSYWLTNGQVANNVVTLIIAACFIALLAWQLRAVSTLSRKRAGWTSVAIVVPVFLIMQLQAIIGRQPFEISPPMHTLLKPGDVRIAESYDSIETLRQEIEDELQQGLEAELDGNVDDADNS